MRRTILILAGLGLAAIPAGAQDGAYLDDRSSSRSVVRSLYNAIERGEFARAYSYFAVPPAESVEDYAAGYEGTESVDLILGEPLEEGAAGSVYYQQPLVIRATTADGETVYSGCYLLRAPNPQNDPDAFTPLAIEDGTLERVDGPFDAGALPDRCRDDGADLPETNPAEAEARRIVKTLYADRCLGRTMEGTEDLLAPDSHEIAFRYMSETAEAPMRYARLFRFFCNRGAYNETHVYILADGEGLVTPLHFTAPELDIRYENDDLEGAVESMTLIGYITRVELVNSSYDPDTQAITSDEKWRGIGDASAAGRWIFRYGTFSLVSYEVDPSYDGEIDLEPVIDFNATP